MELPPTLIPNSLFTNGEETAKILSELEEQLLKEPDDLTEKERTEFQGYVRSATEILTHFNGLNFNTLDDKKLTNLNDAIKKFEEEVSKGMQNSENIISSMSHSQKEKKENEIKEYDSRYWIIKLISDVCLGICAITATLDGLVAIASLCTGGFGLPMNSPAAIAGAPLALKLALIGSALVLAGAAFAAIGLAIGYGLEKYQQKYDPRPVPLDPASLPKMSVEKKAAYEGLKTFAETAKNINQPKKS